MSEQVDVKLADEFVDTLAQSLGSLQRDPQLVAGIKEAMHNALDSQPDLAEKLGSLPLADLSAGLWQHKDALDQAVEEGVQSAQGSTADAGEQESEAHIDAVMQFIETTERQFGETNELFREMMETNESVLSVLPADERDQLMAKVEEINGVKEMIAAAGETQQAPPKSAKRPHNYI